MGIEQQIAEVEGPVRHKITVEDFLILDAAGVFGDQRTELVDGEIFVLSPIHVPHSRAVLELTVAVAHAVKTCAPTFVAFSPVSTRLDDFNLPQPDVMVAVRGDSEFVARDSVRIAIEVAYSSLHHDLVKKAALYARAGVPEYWVADVKGRKIIRMHRPVDGAYTDRSEFAFGETIASATIAGLMIDTAALA